MAQTIGNPGSWLFQKLGLAGSHASKAGSRIGSDEDMAPPKVHELTTEDIRLSLRAGWEDFKACRTDVMFIVLLYPVIGLVLLGMGLQREMLPLLFPLVAGFALLGPVAAVGVYEISRRREAGEEVSWLSALGVVERPRFGAILLMGIYLAAIFVAWMIVASWIYSLTMGPAAPASMGAFVADALGTGGGWMMIFLGCLVGFVFAVVVLAVSVVSFPLLLDRPVGVPVAVTTSMQVMRKNPGVVLSWGAVVAAGLVLGSLPLLLGLVIVLPVLGHATWHLYRRAIG